MRDAVFGTDVDRFLGALASDAPAPGGGAAAALSGAAGAALIAMVGRLTEAKAGYEEVAERMRELAGDADAARLRLLELGERDATAFEGVLAAFRMPKETEDDRAARAAAIQRGYEHAAEVPLAIAREATELLPLALEATANGNAHAASDGVCAAELLAAACRCAGWNVEINAGSMKDRARAGSLRDEVASLRARADEAAGRCAEAFASRLG